MLQPKFEKVTYFTAQDFFLLKINDSMVSSCFVSSCLEKKVTSSSDICVITSNLVTMNHKSYNIEFYVVFLYNLQIGQLSSGTVL